MPRKNLRQQRISDMELEEYLRSIGHEDSRSQARSTSRPAPSPPEGQRPSQRTRTRTHDKVNTILCIVLVACGRNNNWC